jgi:tetratricopeptide (TPR) repeat protein
LYSCSKSGTKIKISGVAYYFRFLGSAYKNAKKYEKALQMYSIAINDTDEREFEQNKAQALNGISAIYREKKEFEKALLYHSQSIEILNRLRAKCDLAETYYQHGLTYQSMHQMEKSKVKFEEAIQIFNSIKAPKQVERVRQSMRI